MIFPLDISPGLYCKFKCRMCGSLPIVQAGLGDNDKLVELESHGMHSSKYNVYKMFSMIVEKSYCIGLSYVQHKKY